MAERPRTWQPDPESLRRARELANRSLSREEWERLENLPVSQEERDNNWALIQWFVRRYPTPAERLAYVRRAYARWVALQGK